ncbi:MAG: 30S ribosomal protein S7 [Armatimonadetes bacterium]|nr:30S ribosomal protein S7 [Armatimonadota bacterium]
MPRKGDVRKREVPPDPVFGSEVATRFINKILLGGKKSTAERIFYGAMTDIAETTGGNPLDVLQTAVRNTMPQVEVRPRRVGGANYQVPVEVPARRQITLSVRWIIDASRKRNERTMRERFAKEIMDAANREGAAYRRREEVYRMAEANRAYSHYRW